MTYRDVLRDRDVALMLAVVNIARLSSGLIPFGIIAFYASRNEYAFAGIASAVFMVVTSVTAPAKARLLTRLSPRRVVMPMVSAYGALCSAAILAADHGTPFALAVAVIAAGGCVAPPLGSVVRSAWNHVAPTPEASRVLHALDSVTEEFTFAVAPILTSAIWITVGASWIVPVGAVFAIIGAALVMAVGLRANSKTRGLFALPQRSPILLNAGSRRERLASSLAVYRSPAASGLIIPMFGLGVAMGALSIVLPDWSRIHLGEEAVSGILLGIISLAGAATGLVAGRLPTRKISDLRQYQLACALVVVAMFLFAVSQDLFTSVVAAIILGAGMTPMFIASFVIVGQVVTPSDHTEVNAALGSGFNLGNGAATFGAGILVASIDGPATLLMCAVATVVLCAASLLLRATHPRVDLGSGAAGAL